MRPSGSQNKSFIAGYVRTYAKYLGLDPNFVYDRFCSELDLFRQTLIL